LISQIETIEYYPDGMKKSHNFVNEEMCNLNILNEGNTDNNKVNYMITVICQLTVGRGLILDPTIRWKTNDEQLDINVHEEKIGI